jgi:L-serine kinase (ADP)
MRRRPVFRLVPLSLLRGHEKVDPKRVAELEAKMLRRGLFQKPIWVARGSYVILNGHHRVEAMRGLGAKRIPVWLIDYASDDVVLDRWQPGRRIAKEEVLRRARSGRRFPIKTTRHHLLFELPRRPTPLLHLFLAPHRLPGRRGGRRSGRTVRKAARRAGRRRQRTGG